MQILCELRSNAAFIHPDENLIPVSDGISVPDWQLQAHMYTTLAVIFYEVRDVSSVSLVDRLQVIRSSDE